MTARTVAVSTSSFARVSRRPLELLEAAGFAVRLNPHGRRLEPAEARALLDGAAGLIAGTERLDRDTLGAAVPPLSIVARVGAGVDNVDLAAAAELGIAVRSTPEAPAAAVAELALGGILAVLRHAAAADRALRAGRWEKPMGRLLAGKTVGIVGFGRAGRALARLLVPFGVRLLATDPRPDAAAAAGALGAEPVGLDELLAAADVVTLHAAAEPGAPPLLDRARLALLPAGAIVVNTARGGLIDEEALGELLRSGRLGGAYLDVFEREPYDGPLTGLDSVLLTPHIGSYAAECRLAMEVEAAEAVVRHFAKEDAA